MKKSLAVLAALFMLVLASSAQAEWSPKRSIKLQIGFGAGGSTDIMGRLVAASVEEQTGWNVVAENKPGGGGVALFASLMNQKPDGLTLGVGVNIPILLGLNLRGDTIPFAVDDFDYIATITKGENAFVAKADAPFNTFPEFIEYCRNSKDAIAIAYDAKPQQMILDAVSKETGLHFKMVKHKSGAEQIQSLLGGHVALACCAGSHVKYVESGDLKMIGVYSKARHAHAPEVKTLLEEGYNYYLDPYYYIAAPKGLPADVKSALAKAFDAAIHSEKVKQALYNTLKAKPHNLGPEGTLKMMTEGVTDIQYLINAGK